MDSKDVVIDPWAKQKYYLTQSNSVDWKGTPGVGDILFGLNAVHMMVHLARKSGRDVPYFEMNCYWDHGEDFKYHFEDPETIIERAEYLHNFYYDKESVRMIHHFNAHDEELWRVRHRGFRRVAGDTAVLYGLPTWIYRPEVRAKPIENKVVFWRPLFNKEWPRGWKRTFNNGHWEQILSTLKSKGYQLTEIGYRTPVREAFHHINTSRFCIFYDGMWQYIAKNLCKPVIVLGNNQTILETHNQQGVHFFTPDTDSPNLWEYLNNLPRLESHLNRRAGLYKNFIETELCLK